MTPLHISDPPFSQTVREELANAASHGLGCLLALASMPVLAEQVDAARHPIRHLGVTVFISTMVLMYLVSAVYHALPVGAAKCWLRKCDHAVIFVFIAGSTPASAMPHTAANMLQPSPRCIWPSANGV